MKTGKRRVAQGAIFALAAAVALPSHAVIVFDPLNFLANVGSKLLLAKISHQLEDSSSGTVNNNTWNTAIHSEQTNLNTKNIWDIDVQNTTIDASFTWIINNNGGGEIIPIPKELKDKLDDIMNKQSVDSYTAHYRSLDEYRKAPVLEYGNDTVVEATRARRAANTALAHAVVSHETELEQDAVALKTLQAKAEEAVKTGGRNAQIQVGNALAASQVNQLTKLRSMMVMAEAQRVAEAQARADKDARAVAVGMHMREGLGDMARNSIAPAPKY